ncbi:hypothetical protein [Sporomusa paucivorans]|uniref:hypothetical protein n=1 Tax=Sporomusa paucivorans TaxID=2376 RepID=UPI0035716117
MDKKVCFICNKDNLNKSEVGLNKKLLGRKVGRLYCLDCLADYLEVTTEELLAKVEQFKEQGCKLF